MHSIGVGGSDVPPSQFENSPEVHVPWPQVSVEPSAARHGPHVGNSMPAQVCVPEPQHACVAPGMLHDCVAEFPPLPLEPLPAAPLPPVDGPDDFG
jgi:hypothetical protein